MRKRHIRAALITNDAELRDAIRGAVTPHGRRIELTVDIDSAVSRLGPESVGRLEEAGPEVVLIDFGDDPALAIRLARHLEEKDPGLHLIGSGPPLSHEQLLTAMRAGVSEYLPAPVDADGLEEALERVWRKLAPGPADASDRGRLLAFVGANGGCGCTTLAANLAVAIAELTDEPVAIADLDLVLGDVAVRLGLEPRFTLADAVRNHQRLDTGLMDSFLCRHGAGVDVLASPAGTDAGVEVSARHVERVLGLLRDTHRHVIVDAGRNTRSPAAAALESADLVHHVTVPELPALRNLKHRLAERPPSATSQGDEPDEDAADRARAIRLLVNRYDPGGLVTTDDIRDALGRTVYWTLPEDHAASRQAANTGEPIVLGGRSMLKREIERLAQAITGVDRAADDDDGWLGRALRRFGWRAEAGSPAIGER